MTGERFVADVGGGCSKTYQDAEGKNEKDSHDGEQFRMGLGDELSVQRGERKERHEPNWQVGETRKYLGSTRIGVDPDLGYSKRGNELGFPLK